MAADKARIDEVANQLRAEIMGDTFPAGAFLPRNSTLAANLGVDPRVIRAAIVRLQEYGLIDRVGARFRVNDLETARVRAVLHMLLADGVVDRERLDWMATLHEILIAVATRAAVKNATDDQRARGADLAAALCKPGLTADSLSAALEDLLDWVTDRSGNLVLRFARGDHPMLARALVAFLKTSQLYLKFPNSVLQPLEDFRGGEMMMVKVFKELRRAACPPQRAIAPVITDLARALRAGDSDLAEKSVREVCREYKMRMPKALESLARQYDHK